MESRPDWKNPKGFVSFDTMFAFVPVLLIVVYTLILASALESRGESHLGRQILFDKLVSASDYAVRAWAADSEGAFFPEKAIHPNLIIREDFSQLEQDMKARLHLRALRIGFAKGEGTCIFRLVLLKRTGGIKKLYFCGE